MNSSSARMSSDHSMETCSCCMQPVTSVCQTLEEIDFERGIWSAAVNGDTERVRKILSGGENPDVPDSSSFTALVSERDSFDIISPVRRCRMHRRCGANQSINNNNNNQ